MDKLPNKVVTVGEAMQLQLIEYRRKPYYVDAVQITLENILLVAAWTKGEIQQDKNRAQFIKVKVHNPRTDRQTRAYIGDWVLNSVTGFKVYTTKPFLASFEPVRDEEPVLDGSVEVSTPAPTSASPIKNSTAKPGPTRREVVAPTAHITPTGLVEAQLQEIADS